MATIVRGERRPFGPIVNDISGPAVTHRQVGGEGACHWKMLMNGMHLEGEWNCVEYVVIEPGASVGEHVHLRTEEIYYIVSGRAVVTIDDVETEVRPGDLITTPIGSAHSIRNHGTENMHFFVTEVFPGQGPAARPSHVHVPSLLTEHDGHRAAEVDLTRHFTGDWRGFRLVEVPVGGRLTEPAVQRRSQVLHVLEGLALVTVEGQEYKGTAGLSVAVPPDLACTVENSGDAAALRLIVTEVTVP
jgi:mannose-6-phosphate isomerase-like protein (cupin superfamily)